MKLYELIQLGSTLVNETHSTYVAFTPDGVLCCALGTAAVAVGLPISAPAKSYEVYPLLRKHVTDFALDCPAGCPAVSRRSMLVTVEHLHFCHKWTRQRIAEWLKPIEDEHEQQQACPAIDKPTATQPERTIA